uniref:Inositol hexakisphosphate and diphosphoinositol-pentakisphosphate kinase n=1 Tax=Macrostomum lignano TaxID=282301 RepID=A0A1I8GT54_9PLAT
PEIMIRLGLCAMDKKVKSKPMTAILGRLHRFEHIEIVPFPESVILNEPVDHWPAVDALIAFYSHGFPLDKAIAYAQLRKPFLVFHKPFVEKPIDAEDHNIRIYFPSSAGGGCVQLFRKIGNCSSVYLSGESRVRRQGSFLYEDFMLTDGTDIKVYAIGKDYAHAEARKSPALDGKVERDPEGKEMRCPIILTAREKIIAKKVVEAFSQTVCGFDLLRTNDASYVCDVNGFSFVKSSEKYYDDFAYILGVMVTQAIAPSLSLSISYPTMDKPPLILTTFGTVMELRCVVAVIRHGDRTPKQKLKMPVYNAAFHRLFQRHRAGPKAVDVKLKKPAALQELLDIARELLVQLPTTAGAAAADGEEEKPRENRLKLEQLRQVLERHGRFRGINRKAQLKLLSPPPTSGDARGSASESASPLLVLKWGGELTQEGREQAERLGRAFRVIYPGGESYSQQDGLGLLRLHSTYRHDLKIYASDEGRVQTTAAAFAKGFLDLEGPLTPILVQMVKSANTDGLLDSGASEWRRFMAVVKARIQACLSCDREWNEADLQRIAPTGATSVLRAMYRIGNPARACKRMSACMEAICGKLAQLAEHQQQQHQKLLYHGESIDLALGRWRKLAKDFHQSNVCPTGDAVNGESRFAFSKVPDIYDNIKYDLLHNQEHFADLSQAKELYLLAKNMADIVVPSEYGITREEKLAIAEQVCSPLLRKILADTQYTSNLDFDECGSTRLNTDYSLNVASPERFVRTRLYFTSESHLHTLLAALRFGGLANAASDEQWARALEFCDSVPELGYLTQIVFMIYEDPTQTTGSRGRYHVELHLSPGNVYRSLPVLEEEAVQTVQTPPQPQPPPPASPSDPPVVRVGRFEMSRTAELPTQPQPPPLPAQFEATAGGES